MNWLRRTLWGYLKENRKDPKKYRIRAGLVILLGFLLQKVLEKIHVRYGIRECTPEEAEEIRKFLEG
jgi:hypothetical protein